MAQNMLLECAQRFDLLSSRTPKGESQEQLVKEQCREMGNSKGTFQGPGIQESSLEFESSDFNLCF